MYSIYHVPHGYLYLDSPWTEQVELTKSNVSRTEAMEWVHQNESVGFKVVQAGYDLIVCAP